MAAHETHHKGTSDTADAAKQLGNTLKDARDELYEAGRSSLETVGKTAKEGASVAVGVLRRCVSEHPVATVATAVAAGMILGALLRLRRS